MSDWLLQTRDAHAVVTLSLNDPARFNALGAQMLQALQDALEAIAIERKSLLPQCAWAKPCCTDSVKWGWRRPICWLAKHMACHMMEDDAQEGAQAFAQKRTPRWRATSC